MQKFLCVAALATATPAMADNASNVRVFDHNKTIVQSTPINETVCRDVNVPIYGNTQSQGDAGAGALAGMIIGGILGKGLSGNDDGAAAGAVIGGIVGANEATQGQRQVIGYEVVQSCEVITTASRQQIEVYSHSTIRFYLDGKRYVLRFQR